MSFEFDAFKPFCREGLNVGARCRVRCLAVCLGGSFGLRGLMRNQRLQSTCFVCVFLCRRVRLPTFRAAVWNTDLELLLGLAVVCFLGSSSRYGSLCLRPDH